MEQGKHSDPLLGFCVSVDFKGSLSPLFSYTFASVDSKRVKFTVRRRSSSAPLGPSRSVKTEESHPQGPSPIDGANLNAGLPRPLGF